MFFFLDKKERKSQEQTPNEPLTFTRIARAFPGLVRLHFAQFVHFPAHLIKLIYFIYQLTTKHQQLNFPIPLCIELR